MERWLGKLDAIRDELDADESSHQSYHGLEDAKYGLLTFGS